MALKYLLGIDIGTSGTKTVMFSSDGTAVASSAIEYPMYQPQNGWAEQKPEDWWDAVVRTIRNVLDTGGVQADNIAGVGLSGQMHGLVMLDGDGQVLRPAIIWCDGRTTAECAEITERVGKERLIELSANPALPGFTASKILWVRKHEPELYAKCRHILLPKDYIRYMLTGELATEVSDASGMNLMDIPNRCWSTEILDKLKIDASLLAEMHESCDAAGSITEKAAALTGLRAGTTVAAGAGDNAAAAIGTGVVEPGRSFATVGTSGVIFAHSNTVTIDPAGRVHTFCAAVPGCWTVMSCTLAAGLSLKWLRDNFFASEIQCADGMGADPYYLMDKQAARVPIGANRLVYLPYLMGERSPILDSDSRGVFFGLSAMHTKYDMLRAVMEGVTYSMRECLDVLRTMGIEPSQLVACGGGGASPFWRQMLADVFACPVVTAASKEGPALGAAILAGVASGVYSSVQTACADITKTNPPQQPNHICSAEYEKFYDVYKSLYPALKGSFAQLAKL